MKPRHTIALALYGLGWYLMLPPMVGGHTDTSAPLNSWRMTTGSYDAAIDCRKVLEDSIRDSEKALKDPHLDPFTRTASLRFLDTARIATDDPRLKPK